MKRQACGHGVADAARLAFPVRGCVWKLIQPGGWSDMGGT
jgi:hypothetical protein